ncbi:MAG: helix-turn-helix domain-containing protein [Chloroflexota bacterium]
MDKHNSAYYRTTTIQQRQLLFKIWEETGSVTEACTKAHVSRSTFYYWKERFKAGGYLALEEERSHAPLNPRRIDLGVAEEIIRCKHENPTWGKRQIALYILNDNPHINSLSPNTVRRVLVDADLWN